jgi:YQGE family putative transporter
MLHIIRTFIKKERSYFDKLDSNGKNLFKSFALAGVADPILYTFVNAFLWRTSSGNLVTVALYNLGFYIGLPMGFYFNGRLLKWIKANKLYVFGAVSQGVVVSLLIFLSVHTTWQIWLFGVIYGIGSGFFWANRNFLTLRVTKSENRMYFSSLESLSGTVNSIVVPFIVGWFIVGGETFPKCDTSYS